MALASVGALAGCSSSDPTTVNAARTALDCLGPTGCVVPQDCSTRWQASWDFAFTAIEGYSTQVSSPHPSEGVHGRIDVRCGDSGLEARIDPDTGDEHAYPQPMNAALTADAIVLSGALRLGVRTYSGYANDAYEELTLPVGADGAPLGTLAAHGTHEACAGDACYGADEELSASGTLTADLTVPVVRQHRPTAQVGPIDAVLPWDDIEFDISEGLDEGALAQSLQVVPTGASEAGSPVTAWQTILPSSDVGWSGVTRVRTRLTDWITWSDTAQTVRLAAPLADLAGNAATMEDATLALLRVKVSTGTMFSNASDVASWGAAAWLGAGEATNDSCAGLSCMVIGPISFNGGGGGGGACATPASGVATAVETGGASTLRLRYRCLGSGSDAPTSLPGCGYVHAVDIVDSHGEHASYNLGAVVTTWTALAHPSDGLEYASEWIDKDIPLPASESVVGVAVWAGDHQTGCSASAGGYGVAIAQLGAP